MVELLTPPRAAAVLYQTTGREGMGLKAPLEGTPWTCTVRRHPWTCTVKSKIMKACTARPTPGHALSQTYPCIITLYACQRVPLVEGMTIVSLDAVFDEYGVPRPMLRHALSRTAACPRTPACRACPRVICTGATCPRVLRVRHDVFSRMERVIQYDEPKPDTCG